MVLSLSKVNPNQKPNLPTKSPFRVLCRDAELRSVLAFLPYCRFRVAMAQLEIHGYKRNRIEKLALKITFITSTKTMSKLQPVH